jgi:hypothetical protein
VVEAERAKDGDRVAEASAGDADRNTDAAAEIPTARRPG